MITRSEARQLVLKALYAAELNDDDPAIIRLNVLKRSFWEAYRFKIDALDERIGFIPESRILHLTKTIDFKDLKVGDLIDVTVTRNADDRLIATTVRRRNPEDEMIKAIDNESRYWGTIKSIDDPFEHLSFANELYDRCVQQKSKSDEFMQTHITNWRLDRLALIDRLILRMALTEWQYFDQIPVKVTINEAIELAKKFSTTKSGRFVNGVLDVALAELQKTGQLSKSGKGLQES